MPFTNDITLGGRFMGLFVGVNGTGKTIAAASFPGQGLILDWDGRVDPVKLFYPEKRVEYHTIGLEGDTRPGVLGFTEGMKKIEDLQDRCPYDWVAFDSYTSYSAVAILHQMGVHSADVKRTKGGLAIPDWDEYKGETGVMLQILEILKILPCHVIVTAHPVSSAKTTKQTGSTNDILASMIKGSSLATYGWKTVSILPNYFNEMYYFYNEASNQIGQKVDRKIQTVAAGEIVAKTALPLPPTMDVTDKPFYNVLQAHLQNHAVKVETKRKEREAALAQATASQSPSINQGRQAEDLGGYSTGSRGGTTLAGT